MTKDQTIKMLMIFGPESIPTQEELEELPDSGIDLTVE